MAKTKNESKSGDTTPEPTAPESTELSGSGPAVTVSVPDEAVAALEVKALHEELSRLTARNHDLDAMLHAAHEQIAAMRAADPRAAAPGKMPRPSPPSGEPWRTVALATRPATVAFAMGCVTYQGGEIEDDPARVEVLRSCEGFQFIELDGPEDLDKVRASLAREVEDLERRALAIGYKLVRQGARK